MAEKKEEIKSLFKKMMKDFENPLEDKIYQVDVKDFGMLKIQWKICGIVGYQILEKDKISYKFGEKIDDPDIILVIRDKDIAIEFLKDGAFRTTRAPGYKNSIKLYKHLGWKTVDTDEGKVNKRISKLFVTAYLKHDHHPFILSKLPMFRGIVKLLLGEDDYGVFLPINQSLGKYESQVIPVKVFKHFIDKASNIVMLNDCGCRRSKDCHDFDKSLGCMYMGEDTVDLVIAEDKGRVVTKEEALERVQLAVDNGLIPLIGRAMVESEGFGIEDTGHFLSACFCCPCCCIDGVILTNSSISIDLFHRMEGVTVKVDESLCSGCEECLEVCVFRGMEVIDGIAKIDQMRCLGCGRCETVCPNEAISIEIDDINRVDGLIKTLESHVEIN